jgi:hypothetical protein
LEFDEAKNKIIANEDEWKKGGVTYWKIRNLKSQQESYWFY